MAPRQSARLYRLKLRIHQGPGGLLRNNHPHPFGPVWFRLNRQPTSNNTTRSDLHPRQDQRQRLGHCNPQLHRPTRLLQRHNHCIQWPLNPLHPSPGPSQPCRNTKPAHQPIKSHLHRNRCRCSGGDCRSSRFPFPKTKGRRASYRSHGNAATYYYNLGMMSE